MVFFSRMVDVVVLGFEHFSKDYLSRILKECSNMICAIIVNFRRILIKYTWVDFSRFF